MFAHVLPVYNPVLIGEQVVNAVYPHGVYNCGIAMSNGQRVGIIRSCTVNSRHRLGRKTMQSREYGSTLHFVYFDDSWNVRSTPEIRLSETVHDVRICGFNFEPDSSHFHLRGIGCKRVNTPQGVKYTPVAVTGKNRVFTCRDIPMLPCMTGSQKNWIEMPGTPEEAHLDVGHVEEVGQRCILSITKQGKVRLQSHPSRMNHKLKLRGGTNYVRLNDHELLVCYHVVENLGDNVRDYKSVFAVVEGCFPFYIQAMTPPLKFQSSSTENLIQFPMGLVRDGEKLMVSYGLADADNVIAEIRERDVMNLMS